MKKPVFTVYRGQIMATYAINDRKEHTDQLHIINSLLSTLDAYMASFFLHSVAAKEGFERVLFQVETNVRKRSRPYAEYNETKQFWTIHWKLISDNFKKDDEAYVGASKRRTLKNYFNELPNDLTETSVENIEAIFSYFLDLHPIEPKLKGETADSMIPRF